MFLRAAMFPWPVIMNLAAMLLWPVIMNLAKKIPKIEQTAKSIFAFSHPSYLINKPRLAKDLVLDLAWVYVRIGI